MTDDFELFQDQGGDDPVDADIALITAYLARELSPVQIVAVEDRLANDQAFREKVNPILEAWVMPTPAPSAARGLEQLYAGQGPLSRDEVQAGWERYVGEHAELDAHEGPQLVVEGAQRKRRKISMTRIAAGIAAVVLPVFALAQAVVYVAKHQDAPGHAVAKRVVAPFVEPPPAVTPRVQEKKTPPNPVDVPVGRQLEKGRAVVQKTAPVTVPAVETSRPAAVVPVWSGNPDRLKIAAIANKHFPEVVRGDTVVNYAVVVLNAADEYVWSTYGVGSVSLVIGGDKRTPGERAEFSRANALELVGAPRAAGGGGGAGGSVGAAPSRMISRDSGAAVAGSGARGRGAAFDSTSAFTFDSSRLRLRDSASRLIARMDTAMAGSRASVGVARGGGGGSGGAMAAAGGGGGGRGGGVGGFVSAIDSGSYYFGFSTRANGLNTAPGLQEAGKGESGIQGLKASALTQGDSYLFTPGQLSPQLLRILVVHLAPGTRWTGR